jgi:hypothetical protein
VPVLMDGYQQSEGKHEGQDSQHDFWVSSG